MAEEVGRGVVSVEPDLDNFSKQLDSKVQAQSSGIAKIFGNVGKAAGLGLVAGIGGVVAVGAGLAKIGGSFDEAFDHIQTVTGATGDTLAGLKDSFKDVATSVPASFGDVGDAVASINQKLGLTGKPLNDLSEQFLNLSHITGDGLQSNIDSVTGTFNQWGVAAGEQSGRLDELFRASQATGISVGDLATQMATGGTAFREAGLSFDESASLLGLLAKNGLSAGDVLPSLNKAMATAAKEGKPANEVFRDTFDAIRNAPDDTKAAGIALDVFGAKAGPKFAALIREGKLSYEDLAATIAGGQSTIDDTAASTADWSEKLKLLGNKVMVALEPLATRVFNGIGSAIEFLTPWITRFVGWFSKELPVAIAAVTSWVQNVLIPAFKKAVAWLGDNVVPVLEAIARGFRTAFAWVMDNKEALVGIFIVVAAGFAAWAASAAAAAAATIAAAAPFIAIGLVIGAVATAVLYAYNHFQTFHDVVDAIGRFLRDTLWPIIKRVTSDVVAAFSWMFDWISAHWEQIKAVVMTAINFVRDVIQTGVDVIKTLWATFGSYILDYIVATWDTIKGVVQAAIDVLVGIFQFFKDLFTGNWGKLWGDVLQIIGGVWTAIKAIVQGAVDSTIAVLGAAWTTIKIAVSGAWDSVKSTIAGVWDGIKSVVKGGIDDIVGAVLGLPGKLLQVVGNLGAAGLQLGKAFIDGIKNGFGAALGFAESIGKAVLNGIITGLNWAIQKANDLLPNSIPMPWPFPDIDLPDNPLLKIPSFHIGGIVPGPRGAERLINATGGEGVFTTGQMAALGASMSVSQASPWPSTVTVRIGEREFNGYVEDLADGRVAVNNSALAHQLMAGKRP